MNARNTYYSLLNRNLTIDEINEVIEFKNSCKLDNNLEYFYLANILIMDIYINEKLYNDALNIARRNFIDLDKVLYNNIYYSLLERYIYIYINKKNFHTAYKYAIEKKDFIDINDKDVVNRWYLEMAYIQDSLNEKSKALTSLMSIIENDPTPELKGIVLNNVTKLFIDNKDIVNAKEYLEKSISYSYEIKDEDAKIYCAYLSAKLYQLEDKNRYATKLYSDIFRNKDKLNDEYIGYLNEYLLLLNSMNEYKEAKRVGDLYLKSVEESRDLFLKKDFYSNYLKASINLNKDFSIEFKKLYSYLDKINEEIKRNSEEIQKEASNDDLEKEVEHKLREVVTSLEKVINIINYSVIATSERECLFEYCKKLEGEVHFSEVVFVIFNRSTFDAYPKFLSSYNTVSTFQYKKDRMYERELEYNDLSSTIIEKLIKGNNDLMIDFTDTKIDMIDPITKRSYLDLKMKYLYATPLVYENNLYASIIYLSNNVDILDNINLITLKIASRMLESKLVNLFYQESLRTKQNILQVALDGLEEGLYYFEQNKKMLYLSDTIASLLDIKTKYLKESDYLELIDKSDRKKFMSRWDNIDNGTKYVVDYKLNVSGEEINILEKASPFFDKTGKLLFYIVSINKSLTLDALIHLERRNHQTLLCKAELEADLLKRERSDFSLIGFSIDNKETLDQVYNYMLDYSNDFYYFDDTLFVITSDVDLKMIKHYLKKLTKDLSIKAGLIIYPTNYSNVKNLIRVIKYLVLEQEDVNLITSEVIKKVAQIDYISDCIKDAIKNDDFDVLYSDLYNDNDYFGKFIKCNVKGIENYDNISDLIDENVRNDFEISLLKKVDKTNLTIYPIALSTVSKMIKTNLFDKLKLRNNFYLLISKIDNEKDICLKYLNDNHINYLFDYSVCGLVTISDLLASSGVALVNGEVDMPLTTLLNLNNKMIICDDYIEDCKSIYYEGKIKKQDE